MDRFYKTEWDLGQITSGIRRRALVLKTINFVYQLLPIWRDDPDRPYEYSEDRLNLQLSKFLDSHARNDFPMVRFDREEYQSQNRRVDLAASPVKPMLIGVKLHTIYDPYLVLEGKRLPAPSLRREREYVTGFDKRNGGIQRFKLRLHGDKLDVAVMIGYVQAYPLTKWHRNINEWISELAGGTTADVSIWEADEKLKTLDEDPIRHTGICRSVHNRSGRKSGKGIQIHHLWIIMNIKATKNQCDYG